MSEINVYDTISPNFWDLFDDVVANGHREYWLKGGRNSTKSSFIAITIITGMMLDCQNGVHSHAVALRKVEKQGVSVGVQHAFVGNRNIRS